MPSSFGQPGAHSAHDGRAPDPAAPLRGRVGPPSLPPSRDPSSQATLLPWRGAIRRYGLVRAARTALFGPPKAKALRPTGHSAVLERLRIPAIITASMAMAGGATYVLARSLVIQFVRAWAAHALAILIPDALGLFCVVVTGLILDYTFVTAATRFQMHTLRGGETVWKYAALAAMLFTGLTETATLAYLFYEIEPSSVSGASVQVVAAIPDTLFWVRSAGALVCIAYLVMFVMPLVIRRGDLKHLAAARSGGTALSVMDDLLTVPGISSRDDKVTALGNLLTIFDFSTRRPNDDPATTAEFAELTEHLRALNHLVAPGDASRALPAAMRPSLPLLGSAHHRMHDGGEEDEGGASDDSDAYADYDTWEAMGSWPGGRASNGYGNGHGTGNGNGHTSRTGRNKPGQDQDQDDDPFASGMYRPHLESDYGQPGPASRAARNGHKNGSNLGARVAPTSYSMSVPADHSAGARSSSRPGNRAAAVPKRAKSGRWDAGKTRQEITRAVAERDAAARRILDACDGQISYSALARQIANLGHRVNTRDARDYIREWGAARGYHHVHLGDYPAVPAAAAGADAPGQDALPDRGIQDEIDYTDADEYATWAVQDEAVQQMSDAARRAWQELRHESDDPEGGIADLV